MHHHPQTTADRQIGLVREFLSLLEARQLDRAARLLAPDASMVFPGGVRFATLAELVAWARPRYRTIAKTIEAFDHLQRPDESIVYCFGQLHGTWPDGSAFQGVRFIDRFILRQDRIVEQRVWNDLAEAALRR